LAGGKTQQLSKGQKEGRGCKSAKGGTEIGEERGNGRERPVQEQVLGQKGSLLDPFQKERQTIKTRRGVIKRGSIAKGGVWV